MRPAKQSTRGCQRAVCLFLAIAAVLPAAALGQPDRLSSAESERAVYALTAWLESEDFDASDLTPLIRYGETVVPSLIAALNAGPSPARRERLRRSLDESYDTLAAQARQEPNRKIPPKANFLNHYVGNFEALYRIRAAQALAAIGGPQARKALEAALGKTKRDDVRGVIQDSLKQIR